MLWMTFCFRVCGSYEVMAGGQITDGLIDFTGGIDELISLNLESPPPDFKEEIKRLLCQACARKSLVGCAILFESGHLDNGLIAGKIVLVLISHLTTE